MTRHLHLDPVGGVAGDMFVSAMLDAFPDIRERCWDDLDNAGLLQHVTVESIVGYSQGLAVQRLSVTPNAKVPDRTGNYTDLQQWLKTGSLDDSVRYRALSLLKILAQAEAAVHGVDIEAVHFHEVADWDSLVDIVAAASVIEHSLIDSWSCSPLPLGSGLVETQHGQLPVPAPATLCLLEGLCVWDDGIGGERVTPTGAAIIRYLFTPAGGCVARLEDTPEDTCGNTPADDRVQHTVQRPTGIVRAIGCGAGHRNLPDRPNIVRCLLIEQTDMQCAGAAEHTGVMLTDQIVKIDFDIDDMTAEELAVSMSFIRAATGVLDASYQLGSGKKGRSVFIINVLCAPEHEVAVSKVCFEETSTLGLRIQPVMRRILKRALHTVTDEYGPATVKSAHRSADTTAKVESDNLQTISGLQARRRRAQHLKEPFES